MNDLNKYLNDQVGDKSSKRLWGSVLIGIGTFIGLGSCIYALFFHIGAATFIKNIIEIFVLSGCALELGGIADVLKMRHKN